MSSVDVVVPCYKYAHFLRQCVESVLQQEGVRIRVLIIDDCSPDNTPEISQQLVAEDARVEYRRHEQNKGPVVTFNEGMLEWASAKYSLLISADDLLTPGALYRATHLMDTHSNVAMTYGRAPIVQRNTDAFPDITQHVQNDDFRIVAGHAFIEYCCEQVANPVPTPTAVVRTEVQKSIGGYRLELPHTGDMEMWMRFALHGDIGVLHAPQAFYSQHGQNMSLNYQRYGLNDLPERREAFDSLFANAGELTPQLKSLHQLATKNSAWDAFWCGFAAWEQGDVQTCRECMSVAQSILPEITRERAWKNQLWKLKLGPQIINVGRTLQGWLRRSPSSQDHRTVNASLAASDDSIRWSGWWPA